MKRTATVKEIRDIIPLSKNAIIIRADKLKIGRHYINKDGISYRVFSEQEKYDIIHYMEIRNG